MKKSLLTLGLLLTVASFLPTQKLSAQYDNSPWNGPRWSSVQVTYAVRDWIESQNLMPDEDGEFWRTRYIDFEKGAWTVVITWFIDGQAGETTLLVRSNGGITVLDPAAVLAQYIARNIVAGT